MGRRGDTGRRGGHGEKGGHGKKANAGGSSGPDCGNSVSAGRKDLGDQGTFSTSGSGSVHLRFGHVIHIHDASFKP